MPEAVLPSLIYRKFIACSPVAAKMHPQLRDALPIMCTSDLVPVFVQDAARPTVLLLLLQQALHLSAEEASAASQASLQSRSKQKQEESWPVALATSVCHQVHSCIRQPCITLACNTPA